MSLRRVALLLLLPAVLLGACGLEGGNGPIGLVPVTEHPDSSFDVPQQIPTASLVFGALADGDPADILDGYALDFSGTRDVRVACFTESANAPSITIVQADGTSPTANGGCNGGVIAGTSSDGAFVHLVVGTGAIPASYRLQISLL